ncbi:putative ATP-grasp-modified RiPP [Streptomyces sp. SID5466]|nr:putative ATP-grasp-modified RiPP [Streptomyces sp. SID5466]
MGPYEDAVAVPQFTPVLDPETQIALIVDEKGRTGRDGRPRHQHQRVTDIVLRVLAARRVPVVRLDPGTDLLTGSSLSASYGTDGQRGVLRTPSRDLDLTRVRSVWVRRPSAYDGPPGLDEHDRRFARDQSFWGTGGVLASLPHAHNVNHPWNNRAAEHKPAQLAAAQRAEFLILDSPGRAVFDTTAPSGPGHLCTLVAGPEARALDGLDAGSRRQALLAPLVPHLGPDVLKPTGWHEKAWHRDEHAGGGYIVLPEPGTAEGIMPLSHAPLGNVHWAGSETADEHPGYLEGAIASGLRAAREIIDALPGAPE